MRLAGFSRPAPAIARELRAQGFVERSMALAEPGVVQGLIADAALFDAELASYARRGIEHRVPYLLSEGIRAIIRDANLVRAVNAALGTRRWVMWGPNIRRGVPNQAQSWHTDLESDLWPNLTVAVGLQHCARASATRFLARSHLAEPDDQIERAIEGFGDGRFFLFNAHCRHRSSDTVHPDRLMLFMHFHPAWHRRIPYMRNYERGQWSDRPAAFLPARDGMLYRQALAYPPGETWRVRLRSRLRTAFRWT